MIDAPVRWSPSDLVEFLACAHVTTLDRAARAGGRDRPPPSEEQRLVLRNGREHEARVLAAMRARGLEIVEIREHGPEGAGATLAAMRAGAPAIAGAVLTGDDGFAGIADLLERVETPSMLGGWSYEVVDVKSSLAPRPEAIVQLCAYAARVERLQGVAPHRVHLVLGDGTRASFVTAEYAPYVRAAEVRFRAMLAAYPATRPVKNPHCARCRWDDVCTAERRASDDVADVAFIRATQIRRLAAAGITTVHGLATAPGDLRVPRLPATTLAGLRAQAAMQDGARRSGVHRFAFREPRPGAGFARLPAPGALDVWFDMEGDPLYAERGGLEYLFGATTCEPDGTRRYHTWWAHDRDQERVRFEAFVDWIVARRAASPAMHVYHYAPYEPAALVRLAGRHATREAEIDALLRGEVFVDLYAVVREALVLSTDDYSIKRVETFYRPTRAGDVTTSMGSVVAYEAWRLDRDPARLEALAAYNRDDCESTFELDRWLRARAAEAPAPAAPLPAATEDARNPARVAAEAQRAAVAARLDGGAHRQVGHALAYHRREARPEWREYFERLRAEPQDLVDDPAALGGLVPSGEPPVRERNSFRYVLHAPPQETKLDAGDAVIAPDGRSVTFVAFDRERGRVEITRACNRAGEPLPEALLPGRPLPTEKQAEALRDVAEAVLTGSGAYAAAQAIAAAEPPRRTDGVAFDGSETSPAALAALVRALRGSYLVVQGPPGTGKTWTGARLIAALVASGLRVAITSRSHRAIHHLLRSLEGVAVAEAVPLRAAVRTRDDTPYEPHATTAGAVVAGSGVDLRAELDGGANVVAGTSFALCDRRLRGAVDVLVVEEAGQFALADALAVATCADRLVLLGDPRQLPHVARGAHPDGAAASVLEHLLRGEPTIPPDRGAFLGTTYRLHPSIAAFVSELMYDGRLTPAPSTSARRIAGGGPLSGAGLRALPVEHDGNTRVSSEEAERIAAEAAMLIGSTLVTDAGSRPLQPDDVIVVAPYNLQVRRIRAELDARGLHGVRAGTVDLFQGQEAEVVLFSMTTSSDEDLPRGVDFLFSRERLNVAISRAKTLAAVAYAPALLATRPRSVEDVALVAALARFVELASS